jgi:Skp family chaperone for outer membrane proteins
LIILKKFSLNIFLIILICCFAHLSYCQEKTLKVGSVNIEMLLKNSLAYKAADLEWSRELSKKQDELEQKKQELDSLQKQINSLDSENTKDRKKLEVNVEQLKVDLKYLVDTNKKDLSEKEKGFFEELTRDIVKVVEDYGKENKFDYIVNESSPMVVYTNISFDITAEMLVKYNSYWESKKGKPKPTTTPK